MLEILDYMLGKLSASRWDKIQPRPDDVRGPADAVVTLCQQVHGRFRARAAVSSIATETRQWATISAMANEAAGLASDVIEACQIGWPVLSDVQGFVIHPKVIGAVRQARHDEVSVNVLCSEAATKSACDPKNGTLK